MLTGAAAGAGKRVSGLQHEVLALYRAILRAARRKGSDTYQLARSRFRNDVSGACVERARSDSQTTTCNRSRLVPLRFQPNTRRPRSGAANSRRWSF